MSSLKDRISPADPASSFLRVTLYTALTLFCKGAEILSHLPALETALEAGTIQLYRNAAREGFPI